MNRTILATILLLLGVLGSPAATLYQVTIDTSSLSGSAGYLNFQVGVLGAPDPLSIVLSDFSFDGSLEAAADLCLGETPCPISGDLDSDPSVSFANNPIAPPDFIDYLQPVLFGSQISFRLLFTGLALENPTPAPGTTSFEILLLDNFFSPLFSSDGGIGSLVSFVVDDGDLSALNFSSDGEADVSAVPEPGTMALAAFGFALAMGGERMLRRRG